ncbi:MAG: hypothetical protein KDD02_19960 [Phaeodactylibacter sp.]|nr:hypothetical protein [Phaeodactylibacter sp.]MCB9299794.1 hypothetical protein [Lewinellaceae bacterium]
MKRPQYFTLLILFTFALRLNAQKLWTVPVDFRVDSTVTVYFDLNKCIRGKGMIGQDSLYFWSIHPKYAGDSLQGDWRKAALPSLMKHEGNNVWSFTLIPTEFYGLDSATMASNEWWAQVKPKDGGKSPLGMKSATVTEYMGIIRQPVVNLQIPGQFRAPQQMQYRFSRLDVSNQVLPDPDTSLTIQEVLDAFDQGGFQFFDQMESDGYMLEPFWQYTNVRNPDTLAHTFTISVGIFGGGWNNVMVYTRDATGQIDTFPTGYLRPLSEKKIQDWRNFFDIELAPGESKQIFARVADYDSHETMPPTEFLFQVDNTLLRGMENQYKVNAAVMILVSMSNLRMAFKGHAIGLPHELNMLNYASMILALVLFGLAIGYKQRKLEKEHHEAQAKLLAAQKKSLEEEARAKEQSFQLRERELSLQEERNKYLKAPIALFVTCQ